MRGDNRLQARLVQVSAIMLVAGLALAAGVLAWIGVELRHLSGDISQSRSRLPATVSVVLPKNTNVLSEPQVTLVRYTRGVSRGAAVLFATVPDRHLASFLVLPPSTVVGGSELGSLPVPGAIAALRAERIPVTHVALIDPDRVPSLVDEVGGVDVVNRIPFAVQDSDGHTVDFPSGVIHMDGRKAGLYVQAATTQEPLESASSALLSALVHELLQPTGFDQVQSVGSAFAGAASTDLKPADVLGLVDLRLRGGSAVQCRLPRKTELASATAAIDAALGTSTRIVRPCHRRPLDSTGPTPPVAVVRVVQHYGWRLFIGSAAALGMLATLVAVLLAARWPRARSPRQSAWPPLAPPASDSADIVWSGGPLRGEAEAPEAGAPEPEAEASEQPEPQRQTPG
ncbi:MAG TPA: LCP family protein [Gaiellales bacterium]|jgi:hypothetical protein